MHEEPAEGPVVSFDRFHGRPAHTVFVVEDVLDEVADRGDDRRAVLRGLPCAPGGATRRVVRGVSTAAAGVVGASQGSPPGS
jgi:hypothetical protein